MKDEPNINSVLFHNVSNLTEANSHNPEPVIHIEFLDIVKRGDLAGLKECFKMETYIGQYRQAAGTKYLHENLSMTHGMIYLTAYNAGLSADVCSALSLHIFSMIDRVRTIEEMGECVGEMLHEYTAPVAHLNVQKHQHPSVQKCITYIQRHIYEKIRLEDAASACGYAPNGLQHLLRREEGTTFSKLLIRYKIEQACYLLMYTKLSCAAISRKLGYDSQSYFISLFKAEKGCTPMQFRNRRA